MTVAGLLLAAGAGVRFGGPKALVEFRGETLAARGVRLLGDGGCAPVLVVVGADGDAVSQLALGAAATVHNPDWASGMGSSLRAGLRALPTDAEAVVVALVDQPLIGPNAVRRLTAAWRAGATVAVATYAGEARNPVLLDRSVWPQAAAMAVGDRGARAFIAAHAETVTPVACDGTGAPDDIDTPAELARLAAKEIDHEA